MVAVAEDHFRARKAKSSGQVKNMREPDGILDKVTTVRNTLSAFRVTGR